MKLLRKTATRKAIFIYISINIVLQKRIRRHERISYKDYQERKNLDEEELQINSGNLRENYILHTKWKLFR